LVKCHIGEMSCWWNVMLVKCHVGEMSCWWNVMLVKCHVGEMSCWRNVMLANCHVGEMSCWKIVSWWIVTWWIVMLANCHVGEMSCWRIVSWQNVMLATMSPCTLTFFPPWNSCTDACGFINEHDGQNFTAPLYFMPSNYLRQAAWRIPWLRQPPWLAWHGKILIPRTA
jgi:phosphoribosyl-AMP cyclohydrolase